MVSARLVLAIWLVASGAAYGQGAGSTAEDAYLSTRDAAIAKIKKRDAAGSEVSDAQAKQEERLLHDVETKLRHALGPVAVAGFLPPGKFNLEALSSGDIGFGALDAIVLRSRDDKTSLYVTSDRLLEKWLKQHENWWKDEPPMPQRPIDALHREAFYTQAISSDAAIILYAPLPAQAPAPTQAFAQLEASTQDQTPALADEIVVSVAHGGRLFIFVSALAQPFKPMPACDAARSASDKKAQLLMTTQGKPSSGALDDKAMDDLTRLQKETNDAALHCFAAHAEAQPAFAAATRQAQALIDLVSKS